MFTKKKIALFAIHNLENSFFFHIIYACLPWEKNNIIFESQCREEGNIFFIGYRIYYSRRIDQNAKCYNAKKERKKHISRKKSEIKSQKVAYKTIRYRKMGNTMYSLGSVSRVKLKRFFFSESLSESGSSLWCVVWKNLKNDRLKIYQRKSDDILRGKIPGKTMEKRWSEKGEAFPLNVYWVFRKSLFLYSYFALYMNEKTFRFFT